MRTVRMLFAWFLDFVDDVILRHRFHGVCKFTMSRFGTVSPDGVWLDRF